MDVVGWATVVGALAAVAVLPSAYVKWRKAPTADGRGGKGGSGRIIGGSGFIIGGQGGRGGPLGAGRGGDGGSGTIKGGSGIILGGNGGEAGQFGRGGQGGKSPLESLGLTDFILPDGRRLSEFGRGGDGGAPPILHNGKAYVLADLVRLLPPEKINEVDQLRPRTSQDWWNQFAQRWPHLAARAISQVNPI